VAGSWHRGPFRLDPGGDVGHVAEFPDLDLSADGQAVGRGSQRQTHRRLEVAKVRVEVVALGADDHELARLVGRDQKRDAELVEQLRQVRRVDAPQRLRRFGGGRWLWFRLHVESP
jgi:hypothetical protein